LHLGLDNTQYTIHDNLNDTLENQGEHPENADNTRHVLKVDQEEAAQASHAAGPQFSKLKSKFSSDNNKTKSVQPSALGTLTVPPSVMADMLGQAPGNAGAGDQHHSGPSTNVDAISLSKLNNRIGVTHPRNSGQRFPLCASLGSYPDVTCDCCEE